MYMVIGKFTIAVVLLSGMMNASAKHDNRWDAQTAMQIDARQKWAETSLARREEGGMPRQFDRHDAREARQYEDSRNARQGGAENQPQQDDGKRSGRMTPEERRELRRQIDEAGRNIYAPRR